MSFAITKCKSVSSVVICVRFYDYRAPYEEFYDGISFSKLALTLVSSKFVEE